MFDFHFRPLRQLLILAIFLSLATIAKSTETTITYQGQLQQSGAGFTGVVNEMSFELFDAESEGNSVAGPVTKSDVQIVGGLFQVDLDFGVNAFDGSGRWLEVIIDGEALQPRQRLTAAPVALFALEGPAGSAMDYGYFYALMPPDNAATVAPGTAVEFPQDGPISGGISRSASDLAFDHFNLSEIGVYEIFWQVSVNEAGQLVLALNGVQLQHTVAGRATGTSQIVNQVLIQTTQADSLLSVVNPADNTTALTITPMAGGTNPVSATLVIKRIE